MVTQMKYEEVVAQDKRFEWETAHLLGIGASQIAAVLGEHPYVSRLKVWAEKTGRLEPADFSDNEAVQMGIRLEPFVAEEYERRTGRVVDRCGVLLRSLAHPWAICTPDYWVMNAYGEWVIPCQIKTTSTFRLKDWADGPPPAVWWQVQHEMLVTDAPWATVGVLVGGQKFMWADVQRDDEAIQRIIKEGSAFWQKVIHDEYPDLDGAADTGAVLATLFPVSNAGEHLALPVDAVAWDIEIQNLKAQRSAIQESIDQRENQLKQAIGDAEAGILHDGSGAYTYKSQSRWSYSLAPGQIKPDHDGEEITAIARQTNFRVLRRTERTEE